LSPVDAPSLVHAPSLVDGFDGLCASLVDGLCASLVDGLCASLVDGLCAPLVLRQSQKASTLVVVVHSSWTALVL
jgi:hypothetical protein